MSWYCWVGVVAGILPAAWLWMFVGGWVVMLGELVMDGHCDTHVDTSDVGDMAPFAVFWPACLIIALIYGMWRLVGRAVILPYRLTGHGAARIPEAKVVSK